MPWDSVVLIRRSSHCHAQLNRKLSASIWINWYECAWNPCWANTIYWFIRTALRL